MSSAFDGEFRARFSLSAWRKHLCRDRRRRPLRKGGGGRDVTNSPFDVFLSLSLPPAYAESATEHAVCEKKSFPEKESNGVTINFPYILRVKIPIDHSFSY